MLSCSGTAALYGSGAAFAFFPCIELFRLHVLKIPGLFCTFIERIIHYPWIMDNR